MKHPAVHELIAGNDRVAGSALATSGNVERRPIAAILSCTDERVVPQAVFDQPAGKLYMVRVAGNVYSHEVAGSLEIAVLRLGCPLIVVLGHSDCTAVRLAHSAEWFDGHAYDIARRIRSATAHAASLDQKVEANVRATMEHLRDQCRVLRERERVGELVITGAVVDLGSGRATFLD